MRTQPTAPKPTSSAVRRLNMHWIARHDGGPRRVNHASVAIGKRIFSFGGYCTGDNYRDPTKPIDGYVLDCDTLRWYPLPQLPLLQRNQDHPYPFQRYGHTVSAYGDKIILFGGRNDMAPCNVTYVFDTVIMEWSKPAVNGALPPKRDGHSACIINDGLFIFGGFEESHHRFGEDVYRLDLNTWTWEVLVTQGQKPTFRDFHTATAIGDYMYVFGGRSDHQWGNLVPHNFGTEYYCNKVSCLDTRTLVWHTPQTANSPLGRRSHTALNYNNKLLMFGGYNGIESMHLNDMHIFDPDSNEWTEVSAFGSPPTPRRRHSMCLIGNRIIIFGGTSPYDGPPLYYTAEQMAFIPQATDDSGNPTAATQLMDHNDLYVLEIEPSLRTLALTAAVRHGLDTSELPVDIKRDISFLTKGNSISQPLPLVPLQLG